MNTVCPVSDIPPVLPGRIEGSAGVVLRAWEATDAGALSEAIAESLDHLRPWMPWVADEPLALADRRARFCGWDQSRRDGGDAVLGAFLHGRVIGGCGLHRRIAADGLELGYWIRSGDTRRGLATTVARALTGAALAIAEITHVEIHHDKGNLASRRVALKLGFAFQGESADHREAPGELGIECRWRMSRGRWAQQDT